MPLEAGAKAPPFELSSDSGAQVKLADFAGQRLVLFFFPKAATSG